MPKKKKLMKKLFGKKFDLFDVILLAITIGYPLYLWSVGELGDLITSVGNYIYIALIITLLLKALVQKARK